MIEALMIFALGFLLATLFALMASQFIWRRAVAATARRLTADGITPAADNQPENRLSEADTAAHAAQTAALRGEAETFRQEAAGLRRDLETARAEARTAAEAHGRSEAQTARLETRIAHLEAELSASETRAATGARKAAELLAAARALTEFMGSGSREGSGPASGNELAAEPGREEESEEAETLPFPQTLAGPENVRPISWDALVPPAAAAPQNEPDEDTDENIRKQLLSFSDDVRAAFGQPEDAAPDSPAGEEPDRPRRRKKSEEGLPVYPLTDHSLEERIRALKDGTPGT